MKKTQAWGEPAITGLCAYLCFCVVIVTGALWPSSAQAQAETKPNILAVVVDDLDVQTWQEALRLNLLPNIQTQLIDRGTTFTNSFVAQPLCCPSRASYLTGQYSHNHGVLRNDPPSGGFSAFNAVSTSPVWLQAAGYRTGFIGKYLNGYGVTSPRPPGYDTWQAMLDGKGIYCMYNYSLTKTGGSVRNYGEAEADYKTDVLAGLAENFVQSGDPRPFFLTVTPTAPHYEDCVGRNRVRGAPRHIGSVNGPLPAASLTSFNEVDMSDKPAWMRTREFTDEEVQRQFFNEMIESMRAVDDLVGRIVAELARTDKLVNTAIFLTSDNGLQFGTHRQTGKKDLYEESVRVPLVVRAPGQVQGRVEAAWVMNIDLAPTMVDYAAAVAGIVPDGRSMRPLLNAPAGAVPWRQTILLENPYIAGRTDQSNPYYAVRTKAPDLTGDPTGLSTLIYAHTLDYTTGLTSDIEFYDLVRDPQQLQSRHASKNRSQRERMALLRARLQLLARCQGDSCRVLDQ